MSRLSLQLTALVLFTLVFGITDFSRAESPHPKRLLIIGQTRDDHPPGAHEFMADAKVLQKLLAPIDGIKTTLVKADEPWLEGPQLIDQADGVVMLVTQGARWQQLDPKRYEAMKRLAQRQGAIVALHWAVGAKDAQYIDGQLALLGGTRGGPQRKYKELETDVTVVDKQHPIVAGVDNFRIMDEFYYHLDFVKPAGSIHPLLTARLDGNDETVGWSWDRPDGGRSFGFVCLHFHKNWERVEYRRLITQGVLWTLHLPVPKEGLKVEIDPKELELK